MGKTQNDSKALVILIIVFIITVIAGTIKATETIKQQEMKNAFRNIYTIYSNTLVSTVADMSGSTGCYYSDSGEWVRSYGTEATMPVYKATVEIIQNIRKIAKEVFSS